MDAVERKAQRLFDAHVDAIRRRTDRLFAWLMAGQWAFAIVVALTVSPYAWEGKTRAVHPHVFAALLLGGAITSLPVALALLRPGALQTRLVVASGQMLWSALLIHLTGGRIETHFHVFGSLAFLAFYRDWRVLVPATIIVAADHLLRQIWWPESVYGVANPEWWRFLEHAGWVVFEDVFLVLACIRGVHELRDIAHKRAEIEDKSEQLDWALGEALAAKASAEEANAVKSQFLANMSHELRTPLAGIMGMSELMGRTPLADKQTKYLSAISRSGKALLTLVNDILDFSRMEAGKLSLEQAELDPASVVRSVVELFTPQARARGIELESHVDAGVVRACGDAGRLQQILSNLVANAIKFTDKGWVRIHASVADRTDEHVTLRFAVEDSGIGIAQDDLPRLFKSFSQVDSSNSRRFGGTGLGLAIVKQLAEMMGGQIGVSSEPGKGSTFWVTVRMGLAEADGEARSSVVPEARPTEAARAPAVDAPRLLLAEDNAVNRQVAVEMLETLGCLVDVVHDGRSAIEAVQKAPYAAVLMDCQMPEMNGYDATARIRANQAGGRRVPIVAVTAHAMPGDREKALAAGMDDYLTKPLTIASLERVVRRWAFGERGADVSPQREAVVERALDPTVSRSRKVIELLLEQLPTWWASTSEAMNDGDPRRIRENAHKMKGSCVSVGAHAMARVCISLLESPDRAKECWPALQQEYSALRAALQDELTSSANEERRA